MKGKLTLVGAGPGDPELITIKAVKAIASADVVLYDALVHPELLQYVRNGAEKIYVGKRANNHTYRQEEINQLIVDHALSGKDVVRIKGGDPFIFGRGKEETEYAETFGIETGVVIGISAVNLPGYYGIPLTRRGINESFMAITATTSDGSLSKDAALAASSNSTAVFFMGLRKLDQIVDLYSRRGRKDLPMAIISQGSLPTGKVIFGTIDTILKEQDTASIPSPAIIVIGEAVGTHEHFYEKKYVFNQQGNVQ